MTAAIGIYLFPDVEVLDFAAPFEVFTTASRVSRRRGLFAERPFQVYTVAAERVPVRARGGLMVQPDFDFATHPALDILIVPGGNVAEPLANAAAIEWVKAESRHFIAAICTGAFILGKAGLLHGLTVTTHREDIDDLRAALPQTQVVADRRWVDEGRIATSAGVSAGLDLSLHLVRRFSSAELAHLTATQIEYDWRDATGAPIDRS